MRKDFLMFGSPLIEQPEIDEVLNTLRSGWIGTGTKTARFEQMFREYKGSAFSLALNSCSAALHLAMLAAGIQEGDEVIVPALTFAATAHAVIHAGARPVFADSDPQTMNIDPDDIRRKVTPRTRAIIPVHFAGRPCAMDAIMDIAGSHGLKVIEDCAHAIEAEYRGKKCGTFGDMGCFSFYVTKNIVTGEGGMIITDNRDYADAVKTLALHGMNKDAWKRFSDAGHIHYDIVSAGFKYNMTDIQASLGIHQLPRIDRYWERRRLIWERYNESFAGLPLAIPAPTEPETRHSLHLYTLLIDQEKSGIRRDEFLARMIRQNIGVGVHYNALHLQPFYRQRYAYKKGDLPHAESISERTVSIPLSPKLSDKDTQDVIDAVRACFT